MDWAQDPSLVCETRLGQICSQSSMPLNSVKLRGIPFSCNENCHENRPWMTCLYIPFLTKLSWKPYMRIEMYWLSISFCFKIVMKLVLENYPWNYILILVYYYNIFLSFTMNFKKRNWEIFCCIFRPSKLLFWHRKKMSQEIAEIMQAWISNYTHY